MATVYQNLAFDSSSFSSDSGASATDEVTNVAAQTVSGTATIATSGTGGNKIWISLDGGAFTQVTTVTATGATTATWSSNITLSPGTHTLHIGSGNSLGAVVDMGTETYTYDNVAPTATSEVTGVLDNVGPITGNVASGGTTDDTHLTINGTLGGGTAGAGLAAGEHVQIYDGSTFLGNATVTVVAGGQSTWTFNDGRTLTDAQAVSYTAKVVDLAGNENAPGTAYNVTIDTHGPAVVSVDLATPLEGGSDHVKAGDVVTATVSMSEVVTIDTSGGAHLPHLALNIGGTIVDAVYVSGSGTDTLSFEYAIQGGQTDTDGISIAANALNANSASLTDAAGNTAVLTHGAVTTGIVVDTTAPTATAAVTNIEDHAGLFTGNVASGGVTDDINPVVTGTLAGSLAADEAVHVFDGSTDLGLATVTGSTWSFTDANDGRVLIDGQVVSYTAHVVDFAGNAGPEGGAAYTATIDTGPQVVGAAITDVTFANGFVSTGDTVTITVSMSELTLVAGSPQLTLDIGGTIVNASYVTGDGTDLQFAYTVQPGLEDFNGTFTAVALNFDNGTLTDAVGSAAALGAPIDLDPFGAFPVNAPPSLGITDNDPGTLAHPTPVGEVASGGVTDDFTPTLHGIALGATTISIHEVGTGFLSTDISVAPDGTWSYTFGEGANPPLPPVVGGAFDFYVTTHNADGTLGFSDDFFVQIQENAVCFLAGTRIATATGERPIESLAIGDMITLADGTEKPVKWIGRRSYVTRFLDSVSRPGVLPIRIACGALDENVPHRDLFVSPEHCMCLDGVLIPARHLVNGQTIAYCGTFETIEYYHIELPKHDVLLAEGAAAESWLDCGNRNFFHNVMDYLALGLPDEAPKSCLPLVTNGPMLEQVRTKLLARAPAVDFETTGDADVHLVVNGMRINPASFGEQGYRFKLPAAPAPA